MATQLPFIVQLSWDDAREALELLEAAVGIFKAEPVGNRLIISCSSKADACALTEQLRTARRL